MNDFKTREECLRYYVDKYNKERDWEPEVDFDKLLPMLDNPPTVRFVEVSEVIEIRLEDDWLSPDEDPVVVDEVRKVMEYGLVNLCLGYFVAHPSYYIEEEILAYLDEVYEKRDFSIVSNHSFMLELLMWLVFDQPKLWPRAEEKLRQLIYGPEEKPSSAAPAKKKPSASAPAEEKPSPVISDEEVVLQLYPFHFKNEETAKRFVEQIKNMEGTQIMKLVNKYVPNECIDSSINLYRILYKAGYITTKEKNWYKNVEIKKK